MEGKTLRVCHEPQQGACVWLNLFNNRADLKPRKKFVDTLYSLRMFRPDFTVIRENR
jgi:hypothetical protein